MNLETTRSYSNPRSKSINIQEFKNNNNEIRSMLLLFLNSWILILLDRGLLYDLVVSKFILLFELVLVITKFVFCIFFLGIT
jgi:hypothetical protein